MTAARDATTISVEISRADLAGPVLSRIAGYLAGRAGLTVDRVSDALLLADTIASVQPELPNGVLRVAVTTRDGSLELLLGPFERGTAARLLDAPHIDGHGIIDRLVDTRKVLADVDGRERLQLILASA